MSKDGLEGAVSRGAGPVVTETEWGGELGGSQWGYPIVS